MTMLKIKLRHINLVIFTLLGYGYFSTMSNLQINEFWKGQLVLLPIQAMALIYTSYSHFCRR